jgi:hypothetical protein
LREGRWKDLEILPSSFIGLARGTAPDVARLPVLESVERPGHFGGAASAHYWLLWWNNNDGTMADVPRDAFWTWGLYDSLIVVIPSLDLVVARAGKSLPRTKDGGHYDVLKPFWGPIVASVKAQPECGRGLSAATASADPAPAPASAAAIEEELSRAEARRRWAALIKRVCEAWHVPRAGPASLSEMRRRDARHRFHRPRKHSGDVIPGTFHVPQDFRTLRPLGGTSRPRPRFARRSADVVGVAL